MLPLFSNTYCYIISCTKIYGGTYILACIIVNYDFIPCALNMFSTSVRSTSWVWSIKLFHWIFIMLIQNLNYDWMSSIGQKRLMFFRYYMRSCLGCEERKVIAFFFALFQSRLRLQSQIRHCLKNLCLVNASIYICIEIKTMFSKFS